MVHRNNKDKYKYFAKSATGKFRTNYSHSGKNRYYLSKNLKCTSYSGFSVNNRLGSFWSTSKYFVKSKVLN